MWINEQNNNNAHRRLLPLSSIYLCVANGWQINDHFLNRRQQSSREKIGGRVAHLVRHGSLVIITMLMQQHRAACCSICGWLFTALRLALCARSEADGGQFQWRDERCVRRGIREGQRWKGGKNQFSPSLDMINQLALISWLSALSVKLHQGGPNTINTYLSMLLGAANANCIIACCVCSLYIWNCICSPRRLLGRSNKFCLAWEILHFKGRREIGFSVFMGWKFVWFIMARPDSHW